jgi:hypothetical protein
MLEGEVSWDPITRFLSKELLDSKELWKEVKRVVREIEDEVGVIIFDDTIQEKKWTKENFQYIRKYNKHFISAIKSNRLFATNLKNKLQGKFERVGKIEQADERPILVYIKGYDKPVLLYRQIFKTKMEVLV